MQNPFLIKIFIFFLLSDKNIKKWIIEKKRRCVLFVICQVFTNQNLGKTGLHSMFYLISRFSSKCGVFIVYPKNQQKLMSRRQIKFPTVFHFCDLPSEMFVFFQRTFNWMTFFCFTIFFPGTLFPFALISVVEKCKRCRRWLWNFCFWLLFFTL